MSIAAKIYFVIFFPTLALIGLASWIMLDRRAEVVEASVTLSAQAALRAATGLVADLQLERGRSAQFIAAKGEKFLDELTQQRAKVDSALASLDVALNPDVLASLGDEARATFAKGEAALKSLPDLRRQISAMTITAPSSTAAYTAIIEKWLGATTVLVRETGASKIKNFSLALSDLQRAAENAGRARATGAAALTSGKLTLATLEGMAAFQKSERENAEIAEIFAPPAVREALDAQLKSPEASDFDLMVATLLASDPGSVPRGISSEAWFAAATKRVSLYGAASQETIAAVRAEAENMLGVANRAELGTLGGLLAFLVGVLIFGLFLARSITRPLAGIGACLKRLSSGDLGVEVPEVGRAADMATLAEAVRGFKHSSLEGVRLAAETALRRAETEAERTRGAAESARVAKEQAEVVRGVSSALSKLRDRDLTARLPDDFPVAYRQLRDDFNQAAEAIRQALHDVKSSVEVISNGAREIAVASDDLARRTERQATNLEESSAALRELAGAVSRTAEASTTTKDAISVAKSDASDSLGVVKDTVVAISRVEESSQTIGEIVVVIDQIAFQTNLLALNAGVEAARAGEAGRGFAVVASEVRALAQKSADAAKQIKTLVSNSSQQISSGVELVGATGEAFDRIYKQIGVIDGSILEIASQAMDQSSILKHLNMAIGELDQATQSNAAIAEQSTAACQSLAQATERLDAMVSEFKLQSTPRPQSVSGMKGVRSQPTTLAAAA